MRKLVGTLIGALVLSSLAMAGTVDPSVDPADGTNVWTTGQTGSIAVKGKFISKEEKEDIKYMVYAGAERSDVLILPDFKIDENGGFAKAPDEIFIKKVKKDGTIEDLTKQDKYQFKLVAGVFDAKDESWVDVGKSQNMRALATLDKKDVIDKMEKEFGAKVEINEEGILVVRNGDVRNTKIFTPTKEMKISGLDNGVIKFEAVEDEIKSTMSEEQIKKVMHVFENGFMTSNDLKVLVKID